MHIDILRDTCLERCCNDTCVQACVQACPEKLLKIDSAESSRPRPGHSEYRLAYPPAPWTMPSATPMWSRFGGDVVQSTFELVCDEVILVMAY